MSMPLLHASNLTGPALRDPPLPAYVFRAKGACSFKPGATSQEKFSQKRSAESANQLRRLPRLAILGVKGDLAERLRMTRMMIEMMREANRAFSAVASGYHESWGVAPGWYKYAPLALVRIRDLALNKYSSRGRVG
jgi:hypothetical protein